MSEMFLTTSHFHIMPSQEADARTALIKRACEIIRQGDARASEITFFLGGTSHKSIRRLTIDQLVQCWGLSLERDQETNAIDDISLDEESQCSFDDEDLFEVLGPFVVQGSYIDLEGKHTGGYWQTCYGFTGKRVMELEAVYPPIPDETGTE